MECNEHASLLSSTFQIKYLLFFTYGGKIYSKGTILTNFRQFGGIT